MKKSVVLVLIIGVLLLSLLPSTVLAQEEALPIGLQRVIQYNYDYSYDILVKVSFFVAFMAGILALLSPCILPFIPAYFSYTFKEKKNITKMTFVFFCGFALVFVGMGIVAGFIGEQSLLLLQKPWLVSLAGLYLAVMGIVTGLGLGFGSFFNPKSKPKNDIPGTFLFGMFFALGWTACLGPILSGIIGIGVFLHNVFYSGLLMLFYAVGNLVPLFLLSFYWDSHHLEDSKLFKGKPIIFTLFGKKFYTGTVKIISGLLFLGLGGIMLAYKNTAIFNTLDLLGTKKYFYSIQEALIVWKYSNLLGVVVFLAFILLVYWAVRKKT